MPNWYTINHPTTLHTHNETVTHCCSPMANSMLHPGPPGLPIYIRNLPADANFPAVTKVTTTILYFIMSSMALAWLGWKLEISKIFSGTSFSSLDGAYNLTLKEQKIEKLITKYIHISFHFISFLLYIQ